MDHQLHCIRHLFFFFFLSPAPPAVTYHLQPAEPVYVILLSISSSVMSKSQCSQRLQSKSFEVVFSKKKKPSAELLQFAVSMLSVAALWNLAHFFFGYLAAMLLEIFEILSRFREHASCLRYVASKTINIFSGLKRHLKSGISKFCIKVFLLVHLLLDEKKV